MTPPIRIFAGIATHMAAFAVGWFLWSKVEPEQSNHESSAVDGNLKSSTAERRRLREDFSGMLGVTVAGLLLTPVFYVVIRTFTKKKAKVVA